MTSPESLPALVLEAQCACCDLRVRIFVGPPLEMYDLDGASVAASDLPSTTSGDRVLLCQFCTWTARTVLPRGEFFDTAAFREAYKRKFAEMLALADPFLGNGPEPLPKKPQQDWTAEDYGALEEFENAMYLRHYRDVLREHEEQRARRESRDRRREKGLRLVPSPKPDADDGFDLPF